MSISQEMKEDIPFNQQVEHRVGMGFATTGFQSNFTYFVSPHYSFRYHRHWVGFAPFYGRLDALPRQHDIGIGLDYRLYPLKNRSSLLAYIPAGVHYNHKWIGSRERNAMFYKIGVGTETLLGKHFALSLDVCFAVGQLLSSEVHETESGSFGAGTPLNYYFLPTIRISYGL